MAGHESEITAGVNLDVAGMGTAVAYALGKAAGAVHIHRSIEVTCGELLLTCLEFPNFPSSDDRSFQAANLSVISIALAPRLELYQDCS